MPEVSTNQQQLPDGSRAKPVGVLFGVGMVHSVKVAAVGMAYTFPKDHRIGDAAINTIARTANAFARIDEPLLV